MKTLLLAALFCMSALQAQGPPPIMTGAICAISVDGYVEVENMSSCYAQSGPAYVVEAGTDVQGFCSNGNNPEVMQSAFAACNLFQPTAVAQGNYFSGWYSPPRFSQAGYVFVSADLTGVPGNPRAFKSLDCNMVPYNSVQPSGLC